MQPVNVGPYLYLLSLDRLANECSTVVTPATTQVVHLAESVATDVPLREKERLRIAYSLDHRAQPLSDVLDVWSSLVSNAHEV